MVLNVDALVFVVFFIFIIENLSKLLNCASQTDWNVILLYCDYTRVLR